MHVRQLEIVMEFIAIILEVAHYKQVVVSSWIVQALHFYNNKMKTEQSS